ncbi:RGG repeats nuclear RNA binding protein A-like [Camellia sinensis]|uniref:RGG repeats nuclear RNA binding protein A-like n=1 Tax=Camellia sinensis TaxID=4442 RepID=UPI0010358D98|nr:RGG repeats nuclear RNA binding protein A-like [Camellia sinensis]
MGNWGTTTDEIAQVTEEIVNEGETNQGAEKPQEDATDVNKENTANEAGGKEPEDKEMTLEEYEKVLEEKRKAKSGSHGVSSDKKNNVVIRGGETNQGAEKPQEDATDVNKENTANEAGGKEPEDKEMTLEEYEKVLEEKRKAKEPSTYEFNNCAYKRPNSDPAYKRGKERDPKHNCAVKNPAYMNSITFEFEFNPAVKSAVCELRC